jgi:hypothetical protein
MENKKQTSVEWFAEIISKLGYVSSDILEQAKKIEKQQIIDSHIDGQQWHTHSGNLEVAEQYYNYNYKP